MRFDHAEARTHDYKRHGTTTLFAALEVATGRITADACYPRHRSGEFLAFLKQVAKAGPDRHRQNPMDDALVESARGAVTALLPFRFLVPLAEPAVRLSTQRALHGACR
jgi:hypothetical protein